MTDKDTTSGEPSDAEKLRLAMEAHTKALQDNTEALNQQSASSSAPSSSTNDALAAASSEGGDAVTMIERNPELRLLLNGQEYGIRFCNTFDRRKIGDHMMSMRLPPITSDGPTGFQRTIPLNIVLYLSPEEFYAKCSGEWVIDLREYCIPPDLREYLAEERALGLPELGDRMPDGTVYVGRSSEPEHLGMAMFAEPQVETLRTSFRGAKRYARKRSLETGQDYGVPARSEWEQMSTYNKLMGGKSLGGFSPVSQIMDGWYWASNSRNLLYAVAVSPKSHISHRFMSSRKTRSVGVRLIRYVPVESLREKQEAEKKPKRRKLKLGH